MIGTRKETQNNPVRTLGLGAQSRTALTSHSHFCSGMRCGFTRPAVSPSCSSFAFTILLFAQPAQFISRDLLRAQANETEDDGVLK